MRAKYLVSMIAMLVFALSGCSDISTDSSGPSTAATAEDFEGTWVGTYEFTGDDIGAGTSQLGIQLVSDTLTGTLYKDGDLTYYETLTGDVAGGVWTYTKTTNDTDPACDTWSVTGTATLNTALSTMDIEESGDYCGLALDETASLTKQ